MKYGFKEARQRKKLLKEEMKFVYDKTKINTELRKVRRDLRALDNHLINSEIEN